MPISLPLVTLEQFILFILVMGRMGGIFFVIPLFGGKVVPMRIKAAVVLAMTLLLFPMLAGRSSQLPGDLPSLFIIVLSELLIGLALGLLANVVFAAVEFCGQLLGMQIGFGMATIFDPTFQTQQTPVSGFQNLLAMLIFLSFGIHHFFLSALVESYHSIPIGGGRLNGELVSFVISSTAGVFTLAVKLAAPVMAALMASSIVLGIMARSFPQMNVFMLSMPMNIGIGLIILGLSLPVFISGVESAFATTLQQLKAAFKLLS